MNRIKSKESVEGRGKDRVLGARATQICLLLVRKTQILRGENLSVSVNVDSSGHAGKLQSSSPRLIRNGCLAGAPESSPSPDLTGPGRAGPGRDRESHKCPLVSPAARDGAVITANGPPHSTLHRRPVRGGGTVHNGTLVIVYFLLAFYVHADENRSGSASSWAPS